MFLRKPSNLRGKDTAERQKGQGQFRWVGGGWSVVGVVRPCGSGTVKPGRGRLSRHAGRLSAQLHARMHGLAQGVCTRECSGRARDPSFARSAEQDALRDLLETRRASTFARSAELDALRNSCARVNNKDASHARRDSLPWNY